MTTLTTATTAASPNAAVQTEARDRIAADIESGRLREVEIVWPDHHGHPRGKRIPAHHFLDKYDGTGIAFCDVGLVWDVKAQVVEGLRGSSWDTGMPDFLARPDLT